MNKNDVLIKNSVVEKIKWEPFIPCRNSKGKYNALYGSVVDNRHFLFNKTSSSILKDKDMCSLTFFVNKDDKRISFKKGDNLKLSENRNRLKISSSDLCSKILQYYSGIRNFEIRFESGYYVLYPINKA